MKIKQLLTKTLLVAVGLLAGQSVWADDGITWTFTNNSTWGTVDMTAGKMYDNTATEVNSGGVLIKFESGKANWIHSKTSRLWFDVDGTTTQPAVNYIEVTVPNGYRLTITGYGHSNTRYSYYAINGTAGATTGTQCKTNDFQYDNNTGSNAIVTFWPGNAMKSGTGIMGVDAVNLRDISSVATHGYTVTAKCGETTIDTWSGEGIEEGATYYVPAKAYIYANEKYYVLNDNKYTAPNYGYQQTMGTSDAEYVISYSEYTAGDIVYFAEAETLNAPSSYNSNNASGGKRSHADGGQKLSIGNFAAGIYSFDLGTNNNRAVYFRNNNISDNSQNTLTSVNQNEATGSFSLVEETPIVITGYTTSTGGLNQSGDFDYVIIRNLSEETAAFNALKTHADALVAVDNDNSAANSTLAEAITTQANAVAEAITAGAITNATTALKNAMYNYVAAANPTTGNRFDLTYLLTDPAGETFTAWGAAGEFGWFTDIPTTGVGQYNNFVTRITSEDGWTQTKNGVERYTSDVYTTEGTYALYQKVTLPAGNYSFNADALANNTSAIVMAAGSTEGDAVTAGDLTAYSVDFTQPSESEIKVGLKISSDGTNAANWMAIADLKLYKEAASYVSVTIASSGYSSLGSAYGLDFANATTSTNGAAALTAFAATESSQTSVKLVSIDEAPAATGVILKGTPGATYTIPVKANAAALTVTNLLHAAVTATNIVGNTSYIMQGGQFHLVTADSTVPAGKAYLQAAPGSAKALTVVFVDDLTGVANVNAAEAVQPVKRIVNGQLVIEKNGKRFNAAGAEF